MSEKVLEINGLNCGYGSVQILYDIDLYVDKGEFVTIIGPNGCGKSTLIKTIFGIATHYSGTVQHEGEEVSGWRTDQLVNRGIAYVPQVNNVFPSLTVHENLQMGGNKLPSAILAERIERASTCSLICNSAPTTWRHHFQVERDKCWRFHVH